MLVLVITNVWFLLITECFSHDLPSYFPKCNLDDSNLNNCIAKATNTLRPYIRKGIKEIKFPSIDPFVISNMKVDQESQMVNYTMTFWNYTIRGMDNYDITEVRYDPKTLTFVGKIEFDPIPVIALFMMHGRLLSIHINGRGSVQAAFGPINGTYEIKGEIIKRKGVEHYNPIETKVRFTVEDGSYHIEGLSNGNEGLTNYMLNQNSKMVTDAITPVIEQLAEIGLMNLIKLLTLTVPYDKLFLRSHKKQ